MALDLRTITQGAMRTATGVGVTASATITRPAPPPDPLTGVVTGTPVAQTVPVVQSAARRSAKASDAAWTSVRTALFLAAADATFTPQRGDLVAFAGRTSRLEALEEYAPTGVAIGWFLGVG